jgi:hypothetical protein
MPVLNPTIKYIVIYKLAKLINIIIPTFWVNRTLIVHTFLYKCAEMFD